MTDPFVTNIAPGRYRKESVNINRVGKAFYEVDRNGRIIYVNKCNESRVVNARTFERAYVDGYRHLFF